METQNKFLKKDTIYKHITILSLGLLFLGACGSSGDKNNATTTIDNKQISLSPDKVGPIGTQSSFNIHEVTVAFPNYSVEEMLNYHLGSPYPVIRVSKGVKTLMIINPDKSQEKIFSIIIEDNLINNSLGHPLGTSFKDIYKYGQTEDCQLGAEDMAGKALCYAPNTPNILYVFNGKGAGSNMPTAEILQGWSLESIIWRPKPS